MHADETESLQRFIDSLFAHAGYATRLDAVLRAEGSDLPEELLEIVNLLPPARYSRQQMCDQLNSALNGHGWTRRFRTVG